MAAITTNRIARAELSDVYRHQERQKSNLILEANLLKQQGLYTQAAHKFAAAAMIEEELARQLVQTDHLDKAFFHHFSALSCWTQAGDLHRALLLGEMLLQTQTLSADQQARVSHYLQTLQSRMTQWMSQWTPELAAAAD